MKLTNEEMAEALYNAKDWKQLAIEDREKRRLKENRKNSKTRISEED